MLVLRSFCRASSCSWCRASWRIVSTGAMCCSQRMCGFALCSSLLLEYSMRGARSIASIYVIMVLVGVVRSFSAPSSRAILPQLVREEHFPNAVAWNGSIFQGATIMGPALGGFIYALSRGPGAVYGTAIVAAGVSILLMSRVHLVTLPRAREPVSVKTALAGLEYIWNKKIILGSISLDLFAVLLGGAVALLPHYASEILRTGPWGLGLLRSAPAIGAAAMALLLAYRPLRRKAGATMLWCVAGFGLFTILFGLSRSIVLSMVALLFVGATDMVSVVVRGTLVQVATPDEMRGRVTAVDMIFIGASNEFGQFESGVTSNWFGTRSCSCTRRRRIVDRYGSLGVALPGIAQRGKTHTHRRIMLSSDRHKAHCLMPCPYFSTGQVAGRLTGNS